MFRRWTTAVGPIAGVLACALSVLASSSLASTANRYTLRHPKREHCRSHYMRKVVTVKRRIHGHAKKVRHTVCVRVPSAARPQPQLFATPLNLGGSPIATPAPSSASPEEGSVAREPRPRQLPPGEPAPTCTTTFTGAESDAWSTAGNWSEGFPSGFGSYGCISSGYANSVIFSASSEAPAEIGGVWAENGQGITLEAGRLTLANPGQKSRINNVKPGSAAVTLDKGVVLQANGTRGELGDTTWNGPGTLEIPQDATLRTGQCAVWTGPKKNKCVEGTITPGRSGLHVRNLGTMLGAGISLCRNEAEQPATLENEGTVKMKNSGSFGSGSDCGEVGPVINGTHGLIRVAAGDGGGCNNQVDMGSLLNAGRVIVMSCSLAETEKVKRPVLEIGSSLSEAGSITTAGVVQIHGDYDPTASSKLTISIRQTFPAGSPETNTGTVKVSGSATLAGELTIETDRWRSRPLVLGQKFHILAAGETAGSLNGEFTLGSHCIPRQPGYGYNVDYQLGNKGTVTVEVAEVAGC